MLLQEKVVLSGFKDRTDINISTNQIHKHKINRKQTKGHILENLKQEWKKNVKEKTTVKGKRNKEDNRGDTSDK